MITLRMGAIFSLLFCLVVPISGCGPALLEPFKKIDPIPTNQAVIYVYQDTLDPSIHRTAIRLDGKDMFTLRPGGYSPVLVEPGEAELSASVKFTFFNSPSITLDIKAEQLRYVKLYKNRISELRNGEWRDKGSYHLVKVSVGKAEKEIVECRIVPSGSGD